jgi:hypothetical protein
MRLGAAVLNTAASRLVTSNPFSVCVQIPPQSLSPKKMSDFLRQLRSAARMTAPPIRHGSVLEYTSLPPSLPATTVQGQAQRDVLLRIHSASASSGILRGNIVVFEACRPSVQRSVRPLHK